LGRSPGRRALCAAVMFTQAVGRLRGSRSGVDCSLQPRTGCMKRSACYGCMRWASDGRVGAYDVERRAASGEHGGQRVGSPTMSGLPIRPPRTRSTLPCSRPDGQPCPHTYVDVCSHCVHPMLARLGVHYESRTPQARFQRHSRHSRPSVHRFPPALLSCRVHPPGASPMCHGCVSGTQACWQKQHDMLRVPPSPRARHPAPAASDVACRTRNVPRSNSTGIHHATAPV
jgi:hypothetical protein